MAADMTDRERFQDSAQERHLKGYNCAQAVACALGEALDLSQGAGFDEADLFRATEGLGLGMGSMGGTCGAISGACVVAGILESTANLDHPDSKGATYRVCRQLMERYGELVGSTTCEVIKGRTGGEVLMACHDCVGVGAGVAYDVLVAP